MATAKKTDIARGLKQDRAREAAKQPYEAYEVAYQAKRPAPRMPR